jgi:hypothetical protein
MSIHKAPGQQQWWVSVNETTIGYFPPGADPTWEEGGLELPYLKNPREPPSPNIFQLWMTSNTNACCLVV